MAAKYVFVTGGVVSGLGKGITAASLGRLLKSRGLTVSVKKLDPYLNIDPGTMNPIQHGEVFVTDDGAETDLDLGHYERFIDVSLSQNSSVTSGKVYWNVLQKERQGDYDGGTVQVIPHITNEIKRRIELDADKYDVHIIEIGGTVGDIEGLPFLEAIRQFASQRRRDCLFLHVTLVPYIAASQELKTKPTQHSVKELLSLGIQPDIIVCRSEQHLPSDLRDKIALFCNVKRECVIENCDVSLLYEAPLVLEEEGLASIVCKEFGLGDLEPDLAEWTHMVDCLRNPTVTVNIALVGKYVELHDAYLSVARGPQARRHPGRRRGEYSVDRFRDRHRRDGLSGAVQRGWHPGAWWLRLPRGGGKNRRRPLCPRKPDPLPGHLPGHAGRGSGIRPQCAGIRRRQHGGDRSRLSSQCY